MASLKSIPSVLIRECEVALLFQVHGLPSAACGERLSDYAISELPALGRSAAGDDLVFMSNGPGMWLVQSDHRDCEATLLRLREQLSGTDATVTELSSARLIVRISGHSSRVLLKKGCPLDIDSLKAGDVVSTLIGHLGATIHCCGDEFTIYVLQSFGADFWEWCRQNTLEFNI